MLPINSHFYVYLNDTLYCSCCQPVEAKSKLTFPTTSTNPTPGCLEYPIAVTKLSFPNLWNYIRLRYISTATWVVSQRIVVLVVFVLWSLWSCVCDIMLLRFTRYWKDKAYQQLHFTIGDNLPMQQVLNAFSVPMIWVYWKNNFSHSAIHYRGDAIIYNT